jgi:hypothetical protein
LHENYFNTENPIKFILTKQPLLTTADNKINPNLYIFALIDLAENPKWQGTRNYYKTNKYD